MKNDMKILIAAIVVILIVLVGAFALSGSNNARPSATAAVSSVTATPMPAGSGSQGGVASPTPVPTLAPTVTPSALPSPMPESGVKLTEFGYWITYPPLGEETWGGPIPPPNSVYFDPTSSYVSINAGTSYQGVAHLHRFGNLSGTTNVTIHPSSAEFTATGTMGTYQLSNVVYLPDGDVIATFNPGESSVDIGITIQQSSYDPYQAEQALTGGSVKLTITDAQGFSYAKNQEFTFNVGELTVVQFYRNWCYLDTASGSLSWGAPQYVYNVHEDADTVYVDIAVVRDGDISDSLTVPVTLTTGLPDGSIDYGAINFNAGDNMAIFEVAIDKTDVYSGTPYMAQFYIDTSNKYVIGPIGDSYQIQINEAL